jgi:hypothetical protein
MLLLCSHCHHRSWRLRLVGGLVGLHVIGQWAGRVVCGY